MWPGLVGKGGPDSEPPIDLDTMLDLTAAAQVDGAKFDGVDLFLFDPHVSIDSTDDDLKRLADKIRGEESRRRLARRAGVAADRRRLGDGQRRGAEAFLTQVRKACAIGRKLRDLGVRKYGVVRIDSAASPADWAKDPAGNTQQDRGHVPARRRRRGRVSASGSRPKERSAGAACTAGSAMAELLEMVGPAEDRRLPGRHGAHAALHDGLQRARGSDPARRASTGRAARRSTTALRTMTARAAAVDDRLPRRAERRDGQGLGLARQDRPPLPARRSQRQARHRAGTPASGCATNSGKPTRAVAAHLLGRLHVPERRDDAAARRGTTCSGR